ncbi:MAG TPA: hypothetical protein VNO75_00805 [Gemmatimonadaceae bacterium]|nr:hypothetical protein [Gemmatimonadaceae bacterium]
MRAFLAVLALSAVLSCSSGSNDAATGDTAGIGADAAGSASGDPDVAAIGGTGVPSGYVGRTDRPDQQLSGAKYAVSGNGWDVTTGPPHILYRPADTASGAYTVSTTIDQLAAPAHPEAYGVFVGGTGLDGANQRYLYFLVRGTGEMLAKVRDGATTRNVFDWRKSAAVPTANSSGQASYNLAVRVASDSVRFLVNGRQAAAAAAAGLPTSGVYGLRINHNLHVKAMPTTVTRP